MPKRKNIQFDAVSASEHDKAVEDLMAEMDRVLARRPCTSYLQDHSVLEKELDPLPPPELIQSTHEVQRVVGQINKANARLPTR